jgi:hypothetical protein
MDDVTQKRAKVPGHWYVRRACGPEPSSATGIPARFGRSRSSPALVDTDRDLVNRLPLYRAQRRASNHGGDSLAVPQVKRARESWLAE